MDKANEIMQRKWEFIATIFFYYNTLTGNILQITVNGKILFDLNRQCCKNLEGRIIGHA